MAPRAVLPPSVVGIQKTSTETDVDAGDSFSYQLTPSCSGLETGCENMTVTDTIPEDLVVDEDALLAQSNPPDYTITYDEASRTVTIVYGADLGGGVTGWPAGSVAPQISIPVTVPENTTLTDGETITNTATNQADNATAVTDDVDVTIHIPRVIRPLVTKSWDPSSAIAGSGDESTITLNVKNESSPSAEVSELTVSDSDADTFDDFNFTGATVTAFPAGADTATLTVSLADGSTADATVSAPAPATFELPAGVNPDDVVGFEVAFSASDGSALPYDATGGTVEVGMQLRDTHRSDGSPLTNITDRITVQNCATPSATDPVAGTVTGDQDCASYDILPDVLVLQTTKDFYPDTNGNWQQDPNEYAVVGLRSPVTAKVDVHNASPFPVQQVVITEPDPDVTTELDKMDIQQVRLRFPAGATEATLEVTCADGDVVSNDYGADPSTQVVDVAAMCPDGVASVTVTYTGTDADGNPSIQPDSTAGLDLHGPLNRNVDTDDLPGGSDPGIKNCAAFSGDAGRTDGTGTAAGSSCATLPVEEPDFSGDGTKTVDQTSAPPDQPIPFHITVTNNGNVGIIRPVVSDPTVDANGAPITAGNPFNYLRITDVTASVTPDTLPYVIEIWDPTAQAWVAYDGADPAVLARATGVRVRVNGVAPPGAKLNIDVTAERRPNAPDGVTISNCMSMGTMVQPNLNSTCSPDIHTGPQNASASLNKSISPSELPRYVPGLPQQYATVDLTLVNTGNMSAKQLEATDQDDDFFDAVDFDNFTDVTFPKGANRVQIDAFVNGNWVNGDPASTAALPPGVPAADVTGIRATFSSTSGVNDGYVIVPCSEPSSCGGHVKFQVSPRQYLRSDSGTEIPDQLEDTVDGSFTTKISPQPRDIPPADATLNIVEGTPKIAVDKGPNSEIAPGQFATFNLKVTNTGTNNVHDLVVEDAIPDGLAFDDTFQGDDGQPFKIINTQVPDGTPAVPTPTFTPTNDGDHVSMLTFDFGTQANGDPWLFAPGSTLTIQIRVGLEPGVTAGEVLTNTMGATGSDDDLVCDGSQDPEGLFGDGTWCTDTAQITTRSGAAFSARKWVAGRASLGWYDTRSEDHVDVGDSSCPSTTHAGTTFTAYPCIALVDPGDNFTYLLRLQNAGTESGRDMRIIDRFPVQGDRGVIVDQDRGTQWANRPTLASEPVLDGPGELTNTYTNSEPICTDDLNMGGVGSSDPQCPASAWDDPYSAQAVAAQMDVHFDPFIPPGGTVNITYQMTTPLDVPQVDDPTIAWNSYAHAEVTDRDGQADVLPATEPIKVGVATAYGSLQLDKVIGDNPNDLPLDDVQFPIHVRCVISPQGGTQQVVVNQTFRIAASDDPTVVDGIPAGAECTVRELDAQGGVLPDPQTVTIDPTYGSDESIATVTVTNDFPNAVIELTKEVTGDGADYGLDSYPVDLYCSFDGQPVDGYDPKQLDLPADGTIYQSDVPPGSQCYVVETDSGDATEVTYDPPASDSDNHPGSGDFTTRDGRPASVGITNDYQVGQLQVTKQVTGAGAGQEFSQGPFTFHVTCTFNGQENAFEQEVTIPQGSGDDKTFTSDVVRGIPAGPADDPTTCVVSETDNGGADSTPDPVQVTIEPNTRITVLFAGDQANPFSAGMIGVTKKVEGDLADADYVQDQTFVVQVTCQLDTTDADGDPVRATVYSAPVDIKAGQTIDPITGPDGDPVMLPVGTHCFGDEVVTGGATDASVDHDSFDDAVVVRVMDDPDQAQPMMLTATNVFDPTSVAVTKKVDGPGAGDVGSTPFTIAVTCVLDQGSGEPTPIIADEEHTITAGETVTIDDLPVGAQCWAVETDDGGAASSTVDHGSAAKAVVLEPGSTATITVINTFAAHPTPPRPTPPQPTPPAHNPVYPGPLPGSLSDTGATLVPYLVVAFGTLLLGAALVLVGQRRRRQ